MQKFIRNIRFFIEYSIVSVIFFFLNILPINMVSKLGAKTFKIIGPLTKANKTALSNFKKAFNNSSDEEAKITIGKSWENLGKTFFELSILNKIIDDDNRRIKIIGLENIRFLLKNNSKAIFFTIHQSNWEIIVPTIDKLGISVGAVYRHINNNLIDKLVRKKRSQCININKSFYTPKGKKSAKDILEAVRNKSSMLLLIDQKDSAGEEIDFFNIKAKTQTGFLKIARKYDLKLIPIKNTRIKNNNFELTFYSPINPFDKNITDNEAMLDIHKIIEGWIIENPTQWFWQHNRFN